MVVSLPQNSVVLDDGEKEPSGLERPISAAELDVRNQDRVTANSEILDKTFSKLLTENIITQSEVDSFRLPNQDATIGELRRSLEEVTDSIDAVALSETEEETAQLRAQRARIVTKLLYASTALVETTLPKKVVELNTSLRSSMDRNESIDTSRVQQLETIKQLLPHWEALTKNSDDVMKHFREDYKIDISDAFLGEMNHSLYLAVNKDVEDLAVTELRSGGGTLIGEMNEVGMFLERLSAIDLSVFTTASGVSNTRKPDSESVVTEPVGSQDIVPPPKNSEEAAQALPVESQDVPVGDIQPIVESTEEQLSEQNQQPSEEANTNEDKTQDLF